MITIWNIDLRSDGQLLSLLRSEAEFYINKEHFLKQSTIYKGKYPNLKNYGFESLLYCFYQFDQKPNNKSNRLWLFLFIKLRSMRYFYDEK